MGTYIRTMDGNFGEGAQFNEMIEQLPYYMFAGGFYWKLRNINRFADLDNIEKVTKLINPSLHSLKKRIDWTNKVRQILK